MVEFYRPKSASKIFIPDSAQARDSHRYGVVRYIGDGRVKGREERKPSLVKIGDVVMFQINNIMEATQKFVLDGKHYMNLLEDDLIARVMGEDVCAENLEMLGDYMLLKHFMRNQPGSTLFLPDSAMRNSAPDFIYFKCFAKGTTLDLPVNVGDEVVVNFGRLTPMFVQKTKEDGTTENQEFCYTRKDWIDGVVEKTAEDADAQVT